MAQQNDQVFQLSLTEIAFTIAFILLLLLGYLVVKEQTARMMAESALAKVKTTEQLTVALEAAKKDLRLALQGAGSSNPEEIISKLIAAEDIRVERDRLKMRVEDLDAKLTALEELRKQLERSAQAAKNDITRETVESAIALQEQVRKTLDEDGAIIFPRPPSSATKEQQAKEAIALVKQAISATGELKRQLKKQLNKDLISGQEVQTVRDIVVAAKSYGDLTKSGANPDQIKKDNSDLRGQIAFLKNRLDARGGRDYPPCWVDETGNVEFLFSVELKPDSVVVVPAWPPRRETDAQALPGISDVLTASHSNQSFVSRIQGISGWSKSQNPECRHYVQLKSSIADAVQSDRSRLMVENYFYKTEARR